ncbi:MAG: MobF family relaxase [Methylacidiphilaceae bacterium]|nr:MobF family relaxase [Candidatus Methylacidiphilaceae bacterium]
MITIRPLRCRERSKQQAMRQHFTAGDYYSEKESCAGYWTGKLAAELGLEGSIDDEASRKVFAAALGGKVGGRWIAGGNGRIEITAYDAQMSAPKSVSILAQFDERIAEAFEASIREAAAELESFAARRRRDGVYNASDAEEITGNMAAAVFHHGVSRTLDPQLHAHCVLLNATKGQDGKVYALQEREICRQIRYLSRFQEAALARRLADLGYGIALVRQKGRITGWRVQGISAELEERFSERRKQIEAAIAEELERRKKLLSEYLAAAPGVDLNRWLEARGELRWADTSGQQLTAQEVAFLARATREPKLRAGSQATIRQGNLAKLSAGEVEEIERTVRNATEKRTPREKRDEGETLGEASERVFERVSVAARAQIVAEALLVDPLADVDGLKLAAGGHPVLVDAGNPLSEIVTTEANLEREKWVLDMIARTSGKLPFFRQATPSLPKLSDEQRRAVLAVFNSRSRVQVLRGVAGAGKTRTMQALSENLGAIAAATRKRAGKSVLFLSPTKSGVQAMQQEGLQARTVASYIGAIERRQAPAPDLLVVDEAGLLGIKDGYELLRFADRKSIRVLLVGDTRQHLPVGAGDFLRVIEQHTQAPRTELVEVRRQKNEAIREAVTLCAAGETGSALALLQERGMLSGRAEAMTWLLDAADYYVDAVRRGEQVLGVARTWEEVGQFTASIRAGLQQEGLLPTEEIERVVLEPFGWSKAEARSIRHYESGMGVAYSLGPGHMATARVERVEGGCLVLADGSRVDPAETELTAGRLERIELATGDRLLVRRNLGREMVNGETLTVKRVLDDGAIETKEGKTIPASFSLVHYGYVRTSFSSQSQKADVVVAAAASPSARDVYVMVSRAVKDLRVFVPEPSALIARHGGFDGRTAAADILRLTASLRQRIAWGWKTVCERVKDAAAAVLDATIYRDRGPGPRSKEEVPGPGLARAMRRKRTQGQRLGLAEEETPRKKQEGRVCQEEKQEPDPPRSRWRL